MRCPGALHGATGPPGVEADQVDRGGGQGVFQACLGQAGVTGMADSGDMSGLGDGPLDAGADLVSVAPVVGGLLGACGGERLVDRAGVDGELPAVVAGRAGALVADRARPAGGAGEADDDARAFLERGGIPAAAALALRAAGLLV